MALEITGKQASYLAQVKRVFSRDNKFVWRLCRTLASMGIIKRKRKTSSPLIPIDEKTYC